jgi:hypothetical protein
MMCGRAMHWPTGPTQQVSTTSTQAVSKQYNSEETRGTPFRSAISNREMQSSPMSSTTAIKHMCAPDTPMRSQPATDCTSAGPFIPQMPETVPAVAGEETIASCCMCAAQFARCIWSRHLTSVTSSCSEGVVVLLSRICANKVTY